MKAKLSKVVELNEFGVKKKEIKPVVEEAKKEVKKAKKISKGNRRMNPDTMSERSESVCSV